MQIKKAIFLFCAVALCLLLCACSGSFASINADQVETIVVWTHEGECELDTEEAKRFVELYNASSFAGKATGEGGTPDFGIRVYLQGEKQIYINEYSRFDFEVVSQDRSYAYYLDNEEMRSFIENVIKEHL